MITSGVKAKYKLYKGVKKLSDVVGSTIGVNGRNVIYGDATPVISNDGVNIAKRVPILDPVERYGASIVLQAALETNQKVGDGTTTSTVLAKSILKQGMIASFLKNPMKLRPKLNDAVKEAVSYIKTTAKPVETDQELLDVAVISIGGDIEKAKIVASAVSKAGKHGDVIIESGTEYGITTETTKGIKQQGGIANKIMLGGKPKVEFKNIRSIIFESKLTNIYSVAPLLNSIIQLGIKEVLFYAPGYSEEVLKLFFLNAQKGNIMVVPTVVLDPLKLANDMSQNIVLEQDTISETNIFETSKVSVTETDTLIVQPKSKGNSKVVVIKIAMATEAESNELMMRVEDAVNAVRAAQRMGVVKGGGECLYETSKNITKTYEGRLLARAIREPRKRIHRNGKVIINESIVDPAEVVITALENAASAAITLLTVDSVLSNETK